MVPCQPRQLVILSLPFAALVAFFWFKRRRSLSRSDPGGTAARQKPGDTTVANGKLKIEHPETVADEVVEKTVVKSVEAVKSSVRESSAVEEEIVAKAIISLEQTPENPEKKFSELVKSVETCPILEIKEIICDKKVPDLANSIETTLVVEKKEIVCNGSATHVKEEQKEIENHPFSPGFENNRIFHSTTIVSEEDLEESKGDNSVIVNQQVEEDQCVKKQEENCEEESKHIEISSAEKSGINNKTEELEQTKTIPKTVKKTVDKNPVEISSDELPVEISTVINSSNNCASSIDTLERVENVSVDTGLGSQEPSAVEECSASMAQGQKTDEKNENAAGLEQKLATLGLDTSQQPVQRSERDSANHSPAEVMLSSPAISTFSDAHSEGSSDSGKGCSDVVTPPSRTPAGGSSVAGDQAPSVYEFILPQVIVGRLIGRHGVFLQDIRTKTHTNVFIKKHPDTIDLKICAIEGTQQDIDAALKMIRQKFPLRRFPDLTLEKVSFVKSPCLPINPENLQLHLVEGVNNDVILSSLITAANFFLQMPMHMSYQSLYKLACIMNSVYNTQESPPLVEPQPNVVCIAPAHGGWYRAQIMSVDEETNSSEVKFLDYGGYMTVDNACLRQIRGDFLLLPFQAVECVLANVMPPGGEETWTEEARQFVQLMTTNQTLQAQVYDYTETGLPLVYLYCTQFYQSLTDPTGYETKVVLLNQELVSRGYADLIDSSQEDQTVAAESS